MILIAKNDKDYKDDKDEKDDKNNKHNKIIDNNINKDQFIDYMINDNLKFCNHIITENLFVSREI